MEKAAEKPLNSKQLAWVDEYEKDYHATHAAIRVGYSPKSAHTQGYRLLNDPRIIKILEDRAQSRLRKLGVTKERVLTEMARIAFADARRVQKDIVLAPESWSDETAAVVSRLEVFDEFEGRGEDREKVGVTKKVGMWDKPKNLEMLAKHLKLLEDRHVFPGKDGEPQEFKDLINLNDMQLAAKISYFVKLAMERKQEAESAAGTEQGPKTDAPA